MPEEEKSSQMREDVIGRKRFLYTLSGGMLAAIAGWIAGVFPRGEPGAQEEKPDLSAAEARIAALEARVTELADALTAAKETQPLGQLEGGQNELVVFRKKELSLINPNGVLLNLVATDGPVGIRFYKDFGFGNEQVNNPWHMGYIEGNKGYQGLAILRDWRFTATLWDEDGKLILGRLDPHPPANQPARARFQVRGAIDEVQALIEASGDQNSDIFQVANQEGIEFLSVNSAGNTMIGSPDDPKEIILYDTTDRSAYSLKVTNGRLTLTRS